MNPDSLNDLLNSENTAAIEALGIGALTAWAMVVGLITGFIGAFLGMFKNRKARGLFLGMVLGPIGWLLILFSSDGDREEGFMAMFAAILMAGLANYALFTAAWVFIGRPTMMAARQENAEAAARSKAETAQIQRRLVAAERAEIAEEEQAQRLRAQREWQAAPKWDSFGKPINRVPPGIAISTPDASAPIPLQSVIRRRTPNPQEVAAEIARKYQAR